MLLRPRFPWSEQYAHPSSPGRLPVCREVSRQTRGGIAYSLLGGIIGRTRSRCEGSGRLVAIYGSTSSLAASPMSTSVGRGSVGCRPTTNDRDPASTVQASGSGRSSILSWVPDCVTDWTAAGQLLVSIAPTMTKGGSRSKSASYPHS